VNRAETKAELEALRRSVRRGQPFGGEAWTADLIARLGLEHTIDLEGAHANCPQSHKRLPSPLFWPRAIKADQRLSLREP
jgi:hypothetical protein